MSDIDSAAIERAGAAIKDADSVVGFTGAGVSTESGIPDFRSPGGIWDRFDPREFTIQRLRNQPVDYWENRLEMRAAMDFDWEDVEPNPAHEAFADLESMGRLTALITQNVDGLHQAAGSENVLELHGTRREAKCLGCGVRCPIDTLDEKLDTGELPPTCDACGGLLKRATISFGEQLPQDVLRESRRAAADADVFLVAGSSLTVEPAASLPRTAAREGATVIVVNLDPTDFDERADVVLHGKAGEVLPRIVAVARE